MIGTEKIKLSIDYRESLTKTTSTLADMALNCMDPSLSENDSVEYGVHVYPAHEAAALPEWNSRSSDIILPHHCGSADVSKEQSKFLEGGPPPNISLSMVPRDSECLIAPSTLSASISSDPTSISM